MIAFFIAALLSQPAAAQVAVKSGRGYVVCAAAATATLTWLEGGAVCHSREADRVPWTPPGPRR